MKKKLLSLLLSLVMVVSLLPASVFAANAPRITKFTKLWTSPALVDGATIGGKPEDIPGMVENMFYGAPNHGNFIKLTPEIAAEIYAMAM